MGAVAEDEGGPVAIGFRHQLLAYPWHDTEDFIMRLRADRAPDRGGDVVGRERARRFTADDRHAPLVAAVDRYNRSPGAFRADEDIAIGLPAGVPGREIGAAEDDVGRIGQRRRSDHVNAEDLAHRTVGAVAPRDVVRKNLLLVPGALISDRSARAAALEPQRRQLRVIAKLHARLLRRERAQDGIEHVLRATLPLLRALRRRFLLCKRRERLAPELIAAKAGQIDIVLRVIARIGRVLNVLDDTPAPAVLHGADADEIHLRLVDGAVGLLDQQTIDAAPSEITREGETNRTAADDEDRNRAACGRHDGRRLRN